MRHGSYRSCFPDRPTPVSRPTINRDAEMMYACSALTYRLRLMRIWWLSTSALATLAILFCGFRLSCLADESAMRQIESLGADVTQYPASGAETGFVEVRLGHWRGRPSDYSLLQKIPNMTLLDMSSIELHDDDIGALVGLKGLRHLLLGRTTIGDSALKRLGGMETIISLSLSETAVTDDGVKELAQYKGLQRLDLSHTRVKGRTLVFLPESVASLNLSDNELEALRLSTGKARVALQVLQLCNSCVGDGLLANLETCPGLANLDLSRCRVTDAGLRQLAGLKKLQMLRLDWLDISDKGLANLESLQKLRFLTLQGAARVTDKGLVHLRGLSKLEGVLLTDTKVTRNGLRELERCLGHGLGETGIKGTQR